jgi:hypothetical protein
MSVCETLDCHQKDTMSKSKSLPDHALRVPTYGDLREYTQAFAAVHLNLLILCGPPGVGKSRGLRAAVGNDVCWIDGNASAFGIYQETYVRRNQPIVLDDVDGLYRDRNGIRLLVDVGQACSDYQSKVMKNLTCKRLQIDEIWAFCYSKQKNIPIGMEGIFDVGDVWTFVAIDADTKLVPHWLHGNRTACDAISFVDDLATRLANRVQISTDGHKMYLQAMEAGFGGEVDFAQIIKHFGKQGDNATPETR